ncbi:60S ribosomal export protein NMD3 [Nematostella vectensis]|uniref:60S ribosomal export protein NMD3 n=1 Tax=Nematostella vectensis TaxID=45351 RepID=UPI002076E624|nr:60S ribosomal export protein NMD3 [Nematostella vectensis]
MEYLENPVNAAPQHKILCCQCGLPTPPNSANMCVGCIRSQVDITEGIPKQSTLYFCKNCERYLQPPNNWASCALESRELLAICLKKLKGLNKVRLIDAGFVWTEPHSKRIKVKLTIQKEVMNSTILQQVFLVEYVVQGQMCDACHRQAAQDFWKAVVQVRQKTSHKKTFFYLEQLIIKHNVHQNTVKVKQESDGIDFYYASKQDARKFVDFLQSVVPCRFKTSEKLISHDIHNNTFNYKYTFSVEIIPICREEVICLPLKLARSLGNIGQLVICNRVTTSLQFIDPSTLKTAELLANNYWRLPFQSLGSYKHLTEYMVLQVEPVDPKLQTMGSTTSLSQKHVLADVWVARMQDMGSNDQQFHCRTHLGLLLKSGDTVLGYDFKNSNINDENLNKMKADKIPDVILVKKSYGDKRKRRRARNWKLKVLEKEIGDINQDQFEKDYDEFLADLEEDKTLRQNVNIYVDRDHMPESDAEDEEIPKISLQEMLEDLKLEDAEGGMGEEAEEAMGVE